MKKWLIFAAAVFLIAKFFETNPFSQMIDPSRINVNNSQAAYQFAQAAQINDGLRRQREMDNGLGFNMLARIVTGRGLTDAEQFASGAFVLAAVCSIAPVMLVAVVVVLSRLTRSTAKEV